MKIRWEEIAWPLLAFYALTLHTAYIYFLPDPLFEPDSVSYVRPALHLIFSGRWNLPYDRTPGYPLILAGLLAVFKSFRAVLLVQHLLLIGTGLIAAAIHLQFLGGTRRGAALMAFVIASLPHTLLRSHSIMTETVFTFLTAVSVWMFFSMLDKKSLWIGLGCGLSLALTLLVRPVGWALAIALAGGWVFCSKRRQTLRAATAAGILFAIIILSYSLYNYRRHGFFGIDQIGGIGLIGPTAKFVDMDAIEAGPARHLLEPIYRDPLQQRKLTDESWVRYAPEGPAQRIVQDSGSWPAANKALTRLSLQGVAAHPFLFTLDQLQRSLLFLSHRSVIPTLYLQPEFTVLIYRGLLLYDHACDAFPLGRSLTVYKAADFLQYYRDLETLKRLSDSEAQTFLTRVQPPRAYRYDLILKLQKPLAMVFSVGLQALPWMSIIFSISLLKDRNHRFVILLFWGFIGAHVLLTSLAADDHPRHAIPVEWVYWMMLITAAPSFFIQFRRRMMKARL